MSSWPAVDFDALRPLKYVFAAVQHGSMRRAAQAFGVQESSVSRNIVTLEQQLDIRIFDRTSVGVGLTEEGRAWLGDIQLHYEGLQEALARTARRNKDAEKLRIGLGSPVGQEFLIRLLERFERTHPQVSIAIEDATCGSHAAAIRRRHLDIAFVFGWCKCGPGRAETIWQERLSILLPAAHKLAARTALTWADLAGERLLVPLGAEGPQFDPCFLEHVAAQPQGPTLHQCRASQATVVVKVQLGKGFTLAGEGFTEAVSAAGTIWRPLTGPNSIVPIKVVWLESNPKRAVLRLVGIAKIMSKERRADRTVAVEQRPFLARIGERCRG